VYRREGGEKPARYQVVGLWGSANVLAEQETLFRGEELTGWTMWDGHALFGPRRPSQLERFPGLLELLPVEEFLSRYAEKAETCEVWTKEELLGRDCRAACKQASRVCPEFDRMVCMGACVNQPRSIADCTRLADSCQDVSYCLDVSREFME
jgi:hypothetical protein